MACVDEQRLAALGLRLFVRVPDLVCVAETTLAAAGVAEEARKAEERKLQREQSAAAAAAQQELAAARLSAAQAERVRLREDHEAELAAAQQQRWVATKLASFMPASWLCCSCAAQQWPLLYPPLLHSASARPVGISAMHKTSAFSPPV